MFKKLKPLSFDWDEGNINKNWHKHRVDYREVEEIFYNQPSDVYPDPKHSKQENRLSILGVTNQNKKLAVVFTIRNKKIRIISARLQSRKERNFYEKIKKNTKI